MNTKKLPTIKNQLLKLLLTAVLPLLVFSAAVIGYVAYQHQKTLETSLIGTIRALTTAVDGKLNMIESSLRLLVEVEDFNHLELKDLHRRLKRYVDSQSEWSSIGLADTNGQQIFVTLHPFGALLPSWSDQEFFKEIIKTQRPVISGYRLGIMTGNKNVSVAVPVKLNGKMKYILVATVKTTLFENLLKTQKLPDDWTATILDKKGIIVARNVHHEKFSGISASEILLKKIRTSENFFETVNKENRVQYGTSKQLEEGWTLYLGMPFDDINLPSESIFIFLSLGGGLILSAGFIVSFYLSKKISKPIEDLEVAARAIGHGESSPKVEATLHEINEVAIALKNSSLQRDNADAIAQQAISLRDNFLSVASHELKTPLTTINLQAQRLHRLSKEPDKVTPEKLAASSSAIMGQIKRLTRLIDDLLDISRITAGKLDVNKEKMDLTVLLKEVISNFEESNNNSTIIFNNERSVEGQFDRNRMEQVITNLISNAIKYGNGKPIEITVSASEGKADLTVKDYGIGIEKKDHHKIFERFERLVSNREISGLGLGLWIVHRIVTQLDGEINVSSEGAGKGSIFTVSIPLE